MLLLLGAARRRGSGYGVTAFCPTTVACGPAALRAALEQVRDLRETAGAAGARVLPLAVGAVADLVVLDAQLSVVRTYVGGQLVYSRGQEMLAGSWSVTI